MEGNSFLAVVSLTGSSSVEFDYNADLDIQVVEMVTSGGEVKEAAIGDQGARLDLQLLGCQV